MRILHLHFGKDGGSERFFVTLVNGLRDAGAQQQFFIRPDRGWRSEIEPCGTVHEGVFRRLSLSRFVLAQRIKSVLRSFEPDAIMGWAPRACQAVPAKAPCIRVGRLGDYPLRLRYFSNIDLLVSNTPDITKRVLDLGWTRDTATISNFTRFAPCAPVDRASLKTPADAFLVVALGRFVKRKGFHTLIEAVSAVKNAHLWLLGDGEERENLERLAAELGVTDRLHFAGWQPDPRAHIAAADVFVMPSSHEPLGNVILEAWAMGKPVVSTKSEGPLWMMRDGEDGLLCDIGDVAGLAAALQRLSSDPGLREKLALGGANTLQTRFSQSAITEAYLALFKGSNSDQSRL